MHFPTDEENKMLLRGFLPKSKENDLSSNLSADAFTFSEPMILDLKFGRPQKFHRLSTTGYALVMEAV